LRFLADDVMNNLGEVMSRVLRRLTSSIQSQMRKILDVIK
jgi:hypothetical protein